jgi:hypothetical protein
MYKNFNVSKSEREQILEMHKQKGYRKPLNENFGMDLTQEPAEESEATKKEKEAVSQAKAATEMLSPEEKDMLKSYIEMHGSKGIVNMVKTELQDSGHGEFMEMDENDVMSDEEFKVRTIIDKIINRTSAAAMIGVVPAAMFISGGVGVALGVTALVGMTLKDAAWWGKKGSHHIHHKEADQSRKDWYN